jgi:hypothetical protein
MLGEDYRILFKGEKLQVVKGIDKYNPTICGIEDEFGITRFFTLSIVWFSKD